MSTAPNPVVGMVNDPDFQKLGLSDQKRALAGIDKQFGTLSDADFTRVSNSLKTPTAPSSLPPVPGSPVTPGGPMQPPLPQGLAPTPPTDKVMIQSGAAGMPIGLDVPKGYGQAVQQASNQAVQRGAEIGASLAPVAAAGPAALARTAVGGLAGSSLGGYGGGEIGNIFGERELGHKIGAAVGGLAGTVMGARGITVPSSKFSFLKTLFSNPEVSEAAKLGAAKQALAENPELAENPQDLINRMKKIVIPGEEPSGADLKRAGDMTQAPTPVLKNLAKFGDRLAQNELNRRLRLNQ